MCSHLTQESGILQRLEQYKPYYQEPRKKGDFNPVGTDISLCKICISLAMHRPWMHSTSQLTTPQKTERFSLPFVVERLAIPWDAHVMYIVLLPFL